MKPEEQEKIKKALAEIGYEIESASDYDLFTIKPKKPEPVKVAFHASSAFGLKSGGYLYTFKFEISEVKNRHHLGPALAKRLEELINEEKNESTDLPRN